MRPQAIVDAARALGFTSQLIGEAVGEGHGFGIGPLSFSYPTEEGDQPSVPWSNDSIVCVGGGTEEMLAMLPKDRPVIVDYTDCWYLQHPHVSRALKEYKD